MPPSKKERFTKPLPVSSLKFLHARKKIWLNPDYQRESVWTRSQDQLLVDSLLNNIDIPKLYFREVVGKPYQYEVVDGQQRLRAIFGFLDEDFALGEDSDPIEGHVVAEKKFSELHTDLQLTLQNQTLDVTILQNYDSDDVEEMFLRLQNGSPLNAAEKRRAIPGNFRHVVKPLAEHGIFELCAFTNKRYAHEDAAAKVLHLFINGRTTDIRANALKLSYEAHAGLKEDDPIVKAVRRTWGFMVKAFKDLQSPKFKKFSIITVSTVVNEMLEQYDLQKYPGEFAEAYLSFEAERIANGEKDEADQDAALAAYTDAARNDSVPSLEYRHNMLKRYIVGAIPELVLLDETRSFSADQRFAIYHRDGAKCKTCGADVGENEWHADHVVAHSRGGKTSLSNGQVLCIQCNLKKSGR
ncbi:MAG TPA: DUF262 domain-containing protein [Candidatus Thermoplasmatota archaeon]|nr:DUF262 domain-containing protein [Candidatus Thermoplasmatota archaeon]